MCFTNVDLTYVDSDSKDLYANIMEDDKVALLTFEYITSDIKIESDKPDPGTGSDTEYGFNLMI